jgi:hypothetical protein
MSVCVATDSGCVAADSELSEDSSGTGKHIV